MLKSALRYIRQKPKAVRNQYALVLASVFTGFVVVVWLASGASSLNKDDLNKNTEGNTPFSNLIKQAKDQFASSKAALTVAEQASSSTDSTSDIRSGEMILTAETLAGVEPSTWSTSTTVGASSSVSTNFGFLPGQNSTSTGPVKYVEVQIATTSRASSSSATTPQ